VTERYAVGEPYPEHLLRGIRWDFAGQGAYNDRVAFEEAVHRHHEAEADPGGRAEPWRPGEVVLRWPRVLIGYDLLPAGEDEEEDQLADLSAHGEVFTAGELLFKLHNAVVEHLRDREQHQFEGLTFFMATEEGDPMYLLRQGWSDE
jgi:hypothetical protein